MNPVTSKWHQEPQNNDQTRKPDTHSEQQLTINEQYEGGGVQYVMKTYS